MKIIMDFRKYDGVVGGVEQGAIQITRWMSGNQQKVIVLCKEIRFQKVTDLLGDLPGVTIHPLPVKSHVMSSENSALDSGYIQDLAEKEKVDVIHFYYNWSFPHVRKAPCLLTVHDVIPFTFREAMPFFRNHFIYRPNLKHACRLNDLIATVSEYSKQDIAKKVGVPIEKIRVIPNGLREPNPEDPATIKALEARCRIQDPFILNVGGIHERKNIVRLVQSFERLVKERGYTGRLIITGSTSGAPYQEKMKKLCDAAVARTGIEDRILFTGFVTEKELDHLLRRAQLLIYPSLYEGFGIPILEAMKVGTPVVTSNVTAMPEVAEGAALLVDPLDVGAMAETMDRLVKDGKLREELVAKGHERAKPYSWDNTCRQYFEVYRELSGRK